MAIIFNKEQAQQVQAIVSGNLNQSIVEANDTLASRLAPYLDENDAVRAYVEKARNVEKVYNEQYKPALKGVINSALAIEEIADLFKTAARPTEAPKVDASFKAGTVQNRFV